MNAQRDIQNLEDIKVFINAFYAKIGNDALLSPIFLEKINDNWQPHLERMYLFWNAALFGEKGYIGNPFSKHTTLPISPIHFARWLTLFGETVDAYFVGAMAEDAKWRASIMAENFMRRLEANKNSLTITIV
jgi:hemoglobin